MTSFVNIKQPELIIANTAKVDPLLVSLLSLCTPHKYESHIVSLIKDLPFVKENCRLKVFDKEMNNQIFYVGESSTVFSCHMDIVGSNPPNQVTKITLMEQASSDPSKIGIYFGAKKFKYIEDDKEIFKYVSCPLGADDKVGVYILLKMIEAKIPGVYLFHTGEECGGLGSKSLAAKHPKIFKNIDRAIAFDRANYGDVISFQRGSRCCSKEFGEALADALNVSMPPRQQFKNEVTGTFTDTASYTSLVAECTNISVGYWDQHGAGEHFDYFWLKQYLLPAILKIDYEKLPVKRDPTKTEYPSYAGNHYNYPNYSNNSNIKRVPWKEATPDTSWFEFPEWEPKLGLVEGADIRVLKTSIGRYISNTTYGAKKDEFVEWLCNLLEQRQLIEEENTSLKELLGFPTEQKQLPAPIEPAVNSELIDTQRMLLVKLITAAADPSIVLYGQYKGLLHDYTNRAKKLLRQIKDRQELTEAKLEKYNRTMFTLATLIDCSEIHTPDVESVLNEVEAYIVIHGHEEGLELSDRRINKLESAKVDEQATTVH